MYEKNNRPILMWKIIRKWKQCLFERFVILRWTKEDFEKKYLPLTI